MPDLTCIFYHFLNAGPRNIWICFQQRNCLYAKKVSFSRAMLSAWPWGSGICVFRSEIPKLPNLWVTTPWKTLQPLTTPDCQDTNEIPLIQAQTTGLHHICHLALTSRNQWEHKRSNHCPAIAVHGFTRTSRSRLHSARGENSSVEHELQNGSS